MGSRLCVLRLDWDPSQSDEGCPRSTEGVVAESGIAGHPLSRPAPQYGDDASRHGSASQNRARDSGAQSDQHDAGRVM